MGIQTLLPHVWLGFLGLCFGLITAGGVFTTVIVIGLVPRFTARFHAAKRIFLFENCLMTGSVIGGIVGVYGELLLELLPGGRSGIWLSAGHVGIVLYGLFTGIFVGCLALAIEEMLGGIPIFTRRVHLRKGLGVILLVVAIGKTCGSLYYFAARVFLTGG